jgi:hypothetical protein
LPAPIPLCPHDVDAVFEGNGIGNTLVSRSARRRYLWLMEARSELCSDRARIEGVVDVNPTTQRSTHRHATGASAR